MTDFERIDRIVKRYTFGGLLGSAKPRLYVHDGAFLTDEERDRMLSKGRVTIYFSVHVPDRDDRQRTTVLSTEFHLSMTVLCVMPDAAIERAITTHIQEFWTHEFWESIQYDGKRLRDMHEPVTS